MSKHHNKTVVVTGGTSGIGFATAKKFKELGANVVLTGRSENRVARAAEDLGVAGIVADQASLDQISSLVEQVKEKFGNVDALFINAGVAHFSPIELTTEEEFDSMMDVNFKGAYFTLQKFIPILNDGASVTHLSSVTAYAAMGNSSVYCGTKSALNSLTRIAATELAPRNIRVNSVNPGPVNTDLFKKLGMPEDATQQFTSAMSERVPLKRFAESEDIANMVSFLASEDASYITGAEYNVDGGLNLNPLL